MTRNAACDKEDTFDTRTYRAMCSWFGISYFKTFLFDRVLKIFFFCRDGWMILMWILSSLDSLMTNECSLSARCLWDFNILIKTSSSIRLQILGLLRHVRRLLDSLFGYRWSSWKTNDTWYNNSKIRNPFVHLRMAFSPFLLRIHWISRRTSKPKKRAT